jgi:hypothetical protein
MLLQQGLLWLVLTAAGVCFAAPAPKKNIAPAPLSQYLRVEIGHQSKQALLLTKQSLHRTKVYALTYSNGEGQNLARVIPKDLYRKIESEFGKIERSMLQTGAALNFQCSSSMTVMKNESTHSVCFSMLGKSKVENFNRWFAANKSLVLGTDLN